MPRVKYQKAMKDYPSAGIKKGDKYYYVRVKTGPRSSREMRSLTPFRPSQLTTSDFLSQAYALQERFQDLCSIESLEIDLQDIADEARQLGEEQQEKYDNMPDGLQQGDTGQLLEERANAMSEWADSLEQAVSSAAEKANEFKKNQEAWDEWDEAEQKAAEEGRDFADDEPEEERMDEAEVVEEVKAEVDEPEIN